MKMLALVGHQSAIRSNRLRVIAALLLAAGFSGPAMADDPVTGIYAGADVFANYQLESNGAIGSLGSASTPATLDFKHPGAGGSINLGFAYSSGFRPELSLTHVRTRIVSGAAPVALSDSYLTADRFMGNLWYDINPGHVLVPYIGAGVGAQRTNIVGGGSGADTGLAYQAGAGLTLWLGRHVAASADYRYVDASRPEYTSGNTTLQTRYRTSQIGLGLKYYFGESEQAPASSNVVAALAPPASQLKCTNTAAGIPVGPDGCPLDSDQDGVPDYRDECPHTPAGAKVLPDGCAPAGDCRTPKAGEAVDAKGCAVSRNFVLKGVNFEFDSSRLTSPSQDILDGVGEALKSYPDVSVNIEGHTDAIGTDAYNMSLSQRRAESVMKYLEEHGIDGQRMTPIGYGKTRPIASNDTAEGRAQNRRVELHVKN